MSRGDRQGRSHESIRLDCHSKVAETPPVRGQEPSREPQRRGEESFHLTDKGRGVNSVCTGM